MNAEKTDPIDKIKEVSSKFSNVGNVMASILGICSGVLSIILGIVATGYSDGYHEAESSYGGDAYTGIQNAAAQTANNVDDLAEIVKFGVSSLLIVVGIAILCFFVLKLFSYTKKDEG